MWEFKQKMETSNNVSEPKHSAHHVSHSSQNKRSFFSLRTLFDILIIGMAVLLLAIIFFAVTNTTGSESSNVNRSDYQAVWVNVGGNAQVYFGHIQTINSQYIVLNHVFYLQSSSTASTKVLALTNLSCNAYNPQDSMVIKNAQVSYWNNLKSSSQITTAINNWFSDGSNCSSSAMTFTAPASAATSS